MAFPDLIILKHLSSVKLTIVLLGLIVVASIIGTIIPQTWTDEQYKAKYGHSLSRILIGTQLTNVYHSYWYMLLLVVFCVNLTICSIRSFVPMLKSLARSASNAGRVELDSLPFHRKIQLNNDAEDAGSQIKQILTRSLYKLKYSDVNSCLYYFERGKIGRLGPLITHASIIVILVGGIFVGLLGFKEQKRITVGETVDVPRTDLQVRADDFKAEFYPESGTPKEYTSVLTIIEDGEPKVTKSVEVNHPLTYKGVKFYQSSYGLSNTIEVELSKKASDEAGEVLGKFGLNVGELFEVPDSQLKIKPVVLVPDFVMDSSGHVGSRSREPRNPAAFFELYEGDELRDSVWSFLKFPDFHGSGKSGYSLKFLDTKYYTELQISQDPGLSVIWIGSLLMVLGLFLSFYMSYKRIWVKLSAGKGGTVVEIGGRSYRNRTGFDREFHQLEASLSQPGGNQI